MSSVLSPIVDSQRALRTESEHHDTYEKFLEGLEISITDLYYQQCVDASMLIEIIVMAMAELVKACQG